MPKRKPGLIPEHIVQIMASVGTNVELAERFGMTYQEVAKIRRSKLYAHLKTLRNPDHATPIQQRKTKCTHS